MTSVLETEKERHEINRGSGKLDGENAGQLNAAQGERRYYGCSFPHTSNVIMQAAAHY